MHQANRDTRLRMACIDHADLVGARQRWRGTGRRFKPYTVWKEIEREREIGREREKERRRNLVPRLSYPFSVFRSPFRLFLSRRNYGGRAQMYEPNEIDAKKRAACLRDLRYANVHVYACV